MERKSTTRKAGLSALFFFVFVFGSASLAQADDLETTPVGAAPPVLAGAWTVQAGDVFQRVDAEGQVVEVDDGRLRLDRRGQWSLAARRIVLNYDVLGRLASVGAHGQVRLVGRSGDDAAVSYAMGEFAWFDAAGTRGLVMGSGVAVVRDNWRMGASHIEIDFGASELVLRGVKSGTIRTRRDDN